MKPIASIILPTYNRAKDIPRAVNSVLAQSLKEWELIIVNDASKDNTKEVIAELAAKDSRIIPVNNEKNEFREFGIMKTLNKAIAIARGRYIARIDDDDYWIDDRKLEKQAAYLDAHPECMVVGGGVIVIDVAGNERFRYFKKENDADIRARALFANPFTHTTVMFRTDVARELGGYEQLYIEDWDLWLRMGRRGTFYNFQEYFTAYTMSEANHSFIHQRALSRTVLALLRRHRNDYPGFYKAYALNFIQYLYSFAPIPLSFRVRLHAFLSSIKRKLS